MKNQKRNHLAFILFLSLISISIILFNTGIISGEIKQASRAIEKCYYCIDPSGKVTEGLILNINDCPEGSSPKEIITTWGYSCQNAWDAHLEAIATEESLKRKTMAQLISLGAKISDFGNDGKIGLEDSFEFTSQEPELEQQLQRKIINFNDKGLSFPSNADFGYSGSERIIKFAMNDYGNILPSKLNYQNYMVGYGLEVFPLKPGDSLDLYLDEEGNIKDFQLYTSNTYSQAYDYRKVYDENKIAMVKNPLDIYSGENVELQELSRFDKIAKSLKFQSIYNLINRKNPFY